MALFNADSYQQSVRLANGNTKNMISRRWAMLTQGEAAHEKQTRLAVPSCHGSMRCIG